MTKKYIETSYARFDHAHLFDGLFIPTNGVKRGRLFVEPRQFDHLLISFQGFEQLGGDDQSLLLAITAQLGTDGLMIEKEPTGDMNKQLKLALDFNEADNRVLASTRTTFRRILIDAGYKENTSTNFVKDSLNRLANTQIREVNLETGWDRRCNLISVKFNQKTKEIWVAANPRLTQAIFAIEKKQHVIISLLERNSLKGEAAKILHAWLCAFTEQGQYFGNAYGTNLDTFAPHIFGGKAWETASASSKSRKRRQIEGALVEISQRWEITQDAAGMVHIKRPSFEFRHLPSEDADKDWSLKSLHKLLTEQKGL